MTPSRALALIVEGHFDALDRDRVVEAVTEIVLAGPLHQDRRAAHFLRDEGCFLDVVGLRLAPKSATQKRHMQRDILGLHLQGRDNVVLCAEWTLCRGPYLALPVLNLRNGNERFHGRLTDVGRMIIGRERLLSCFESSVGIALLADDLTGLGRCCRHLFVVSDRVVVV